jgi:hypothetical protein
VVLVVMLWMPAGALAGGFGSGCGPYFGRSWGLGYGSLGYGGIGIGGLAGRPAYSGYYFRSWNGGISMPVVDYGPGYYAPVVYTAPILFTAPASVHFSTADHLADHAGNSMSRFRYGGAVRFGQ